MIFGFPFSFLPFFLSSVFLLQIRFKSPVHSHFSSIPHSLSEGTPPRPVATPPLLSVAPGSPARFNCVAHSDTPARIKWGFREENGPLPEHVNQDGDDIVISEAGDRNVGEYVCSATNDFGTGVADPVRLEVTEGLHHTFFYLVFLINPFTFLSPKLKMITTDNMIHEP